MLSSNKDMKEIHDKETSNAHKNFNQETHTKVKNETYTKISTFVALLKACTKKKDLYGGRKIHAEIMQIGLLEKSPHLASALIHMYTRCGMLGNAHQVLEELLVRDVVSWSSLISGYTEQNQGEKALKCFQQMQNEGLSPDAVTLTCVLKACGSIRATDKGKQIHDEIVRNGFLEKDIMLGNALVHMYVKCGLLTRAEKVLRELPSRNVITWNTLLAGYAEEAQGYEALKYYECMQNEGISPDEVTFICVLKACGKLGSVEKGKEIHEEIVRRGFFGSDTMLGNALVDMYAKCGMFTKAQEVLKQLPIRNTVTWNVIISGYTQQGQGHEAINSFEQMQRDGVSPDVVTFISILKACGTTGDVEKGNQICDAIWSKGLLENNIALGNALVDMYAKCGLLRSAKKVLKQLHLRNVISWNTIIAGYAECGQGHEALSCLEEMQSEDLSPDVVTFICILKACGSSKAKEKGKLIHEDIMIRGLLKKDVELGNALVDMYAKCEDVAKARQIIEELPIRDVVSWNAMIAGYAQHGQVDNALNCFEQMQMEGISPDVVTFICILKACGSMEHIDKVKHIHEVIAGRDLLGKDIALNTALVDAYAKSGMPTKAHDILTELPVRNGISWSAVIAGYAQHGQSCEALQCFEQMQSEGFAPDIVTFIFIVEACASSRSIHIGEEIHNEIVSRGFLRKDTRLGNALVDMYSKCGRLSRAEEVFEQLAIRDEVSWNVLIAGYAEHARDHEVFICFMSMQNEGLTPDRITFIFILKACGYAGAIDKGIQIHKEIMSKDLLEKDIVLGNALMDMYVRCGVLVNAQKLLEELHVRDIVSWNALLSGFAQQARGHEALKCFERLQCESLSPDEVTFQCILSACSHSGLMDEAQVIFGNMKTKYGIAPKVDHYTCMVMGFGCEGNFAKAMSIIKVMPCSDYPPLWLALLGACKKWGNLDLARLAFHQVVQLDCNSATAYVLMANIYAAAGMQEDADRVSSINHNLVKYKAVDVIDHFLEDIDSNVDIFK